HRRSPLAARVTSPPSEPPPQATYGRRPPLARIPPFPPHQRRWRALHFPSCTSSADDWNWGYFVRTPIGIGHLTDENTPRGAFCGFELVPEIPKRVEIEL